MNMNMKWFMTKVIIEIKTTYFLAMCTLPATCMSGDLGSTREPIEAAVTYDFATCAPLHISAYYNVSWPCRACANVTKPTRGTAGSRWCRMLKIRENVLKAIFSR